MRRALVLLAALASLLAGTTAPALATDRPLPLPQPVEPGPYAADPAGPYAAPPAPGSRAAAPEGPRGDPREEGARVFQGKAFDTCVAPSYDTMRAWTDSPYRGVGVYIGGRGRACPEQPNLDRRWVSDVSELGWRLLPLYVGSQAPCVHAERKRPYALDSDDPRRRGVREGRDAVAQARELGLAANSPVYLDMEAYDEDDAQCARTTLEFIQGWSSEVRRLDRIPGFYSSATSGVVHLERAREAGAPDLPDVVWFARWEGPASLHDEPALAPGAWQPHRRIHQYEGNVRRTYGGRTLLVDENMVDAPVAILR
ncbi:DUF1906 domain-containing protein [Streptomyces oceani]|uniref:DUF1906 domain-containing protein n=1 Tax=Streptomyces oceani TaxID=1075402 RepID=UPI0009A12136|nr:DUF1906 domain-containing protein [Streptomyces oceani]